MSEQNQQVDTTQLFNQIWSMANNLRGNMDASEYKNYILGFLFYRFLSEKLEQEVYANELLEYSVDLNIREEEFASMTFAQAYKHVLEVMVQNEKPGISEKDEDYHTYYKAAAVKVSQEANLAYTILPEYLWSNLIDLINSNKIFASTYTDLFEAFNEGILDEGREDFENIFVDVNLRATRLGSDSNSRTQFLNEVCLKVNDMHFKDEKGRDLLGAIYENLIGKFAANAGKTGGEFYTPHEVSQLIAQIVTHNVAQILEPNDEFLVLDPTCGSGSLLLTVRTALNNNPEFVAKTALRNANERVKFYGQEKNFTTYNLARMNLLMHDVNPKDMKLENGDTLDSDWPTVDLENRSFDGFVHAVVANPPYSAHWDPAPEKLSDPRFAPYGKLAPKTKADFSFLLHGLYHLKDNGTMAIVLPHGVLFRGAAEATIRKALIEKNYLDTVIGLPANLFYGTGIPTIILVFKKNRQNQDVLFIDASKEFEKDKKQNRLTEENINKIVETYVNRVNVDKYAYVASIDEIIENDYNLNIPRYVDTFEEEEQIDLEQVILDIDRDKKEIARLEASIYAQLKELGVDVEEIIKRNQKDQD
ncbi:type I restriction-modification system subunit M [Psittacicella gerlachiana]|uniref:site-specific DNA-methyltransferase (adenine-specific) n=1 Tax=Psittacicella gerlachiana TaxID=2028574 RepID=A0A3A1YGX7_9GAMM|nr:type I restriction-modification system subunit M [Psittacicella gerlachiana]RIY35474.1 type I restriction-modification system subunit M [Psittacicella gerlachiana]